MSLWYIALIVAIVIIVTQENKTKNNNLNMSQHKGISFCPKCGFDFRKVFHRINFCPGCGYNFVPIPNNNIIQNNKIKEKPTEKEIKNSLILTVGAILVIISAIAFLASTWNITGNFLKTIVLVLMLIVFFTISYIAENKLKLKQTAKTFYYIALAYIPIVLLSISMFSLFGNYLSLYGEGKYLYLTLSSIIVSYIYYFNSIKRNSKTLFSFNIIFQILGVIFFTLIFTNKFSSILFGLIIYSTIVSILYLVNKIYFNENTHRTLSSVLCFSLSIILLYGNFINNLANNIFVIDVIAFVFMFINLYLVLVKILNKDDIYKFIYPITIILTFNNITRLFNGNIMFMQSLILLSFLVTYLYNLIKEQKINIITYVEVLISFSIFYFIWLIAGIFNNNMIPGYILFGVMTLLSLIHYIFNIKYKTFSSVMLAVGVVITSIASASYFNFNSIVLGLIAFLLIVISMIKSMNSGLRTGFKWVGIIALTIITLDITHIHNLVLCSLYSLIILVYGIINKDDVYKIFSYIYINIVLLYIFDYVRLDYTIFIIPSTTVILTFAERLYSVIRTKASDTYLTICYILSTLMLLNTLGEYNNIAMIILSLSFVYYVIYYKKNHNYLCIPFIGMIPHIYFNYDLAINEFNLMYIVSILAILGIGYLIHSKKKNLYITMFYIYSFFHISCLENIKYISILLIIGGSFVCYLIKNNKVKDTYKALLYILGLVLYNTILTDLGLSYLSSLTLISYIVVLILITRTILKKYGENYKVWEYTISIFINLLSLGSFTNQYDQIIYVILLTILIIVSYVYKFGPIFLISLISIVLNSLILTRTIFGNIPWWIYILIIGGILIGFAIYNEAKDKNNENNEKNKLDL